MWRERLRRTTTSAFWSIFVLVGGQGTDGDENV